MIKKIYVFLREDLSNPQKIVQACHSIYEIGKDFREEVPPHVIVIGVRNQTALIKAMDEVQYLGVKIREFREPDIGNELTSFSTEPLTDHSLMKKFKIIKDSSFRESIQELESKRSEIDKKLREAKESCPHPRWEARYVESMAYEFSPRNVCCDCRKIINTPVTERDKEKLLVDFYADIEVALTEEDKRSKIDGFNI